MRRAELERLAPVLNDGVDVPESPGFPFVLAAGNRERKFLYPVATGDSAAVWSATPWIFSFTRPLFLVDRLKIRRASSERFTIEIPS